MSVITKSMPDEITEQISMGDDVFTLSLVADEELEISLAFTQLESVLDIRFTNYLFALEKRLKILFAAKNIKKSNMPFGVASVCWIFSQTLDYLDSETSIKSSIIDFLRKQLSVELLEVYKTIDKKFVQAGILPNIKIKPKTLIRDGALKTKPEESNSPAQNMGTQNTGFTPNNGLSQQQNDQEELIQSKSAELVKNIFDLMNQGRSSSQTAAGSSSQSAMGVIQSNSCRVIKSIGYGVTQSNSCRVIKSIVYGVTQSNSCRVIKSIGYGVI